MSVTRIHKGHDISHDDDRELDRYDRVCFYTDNGQRIDVTVVENHLEVYYPDGTIAISPRTGNTSWVTPVPSNDVDLRERLDLA